MSSRSRRTSDRVRRGPARPSAGPAGRPHGLGLPWAMAADPTPAPRLPAHRPQDLAHGRAPARDDLLRPRGRRVLRPTSAWPPRGRLLRLAVGRHGGGGSRHGDRHLLQLQPRRWSGRPSPRRGTGLARPPCSRPGWKRPTPPCAGCSATPSTPPRWPGPPSWPAGPPSGPHSATRGDPCSPPTPDCPGPSAPHLVLWHAQTLLREFRGDGHIAALVVHDLDPVEALVLHLATGELPETFLRGTRGWPDAEWEAGVDRLVARGLVDRWSRSEDHRASPGPHRHGGHALRQEIEDATDRLAVYRLRGPGRGRVCRAADPGPPVQPGGGGRGRLRA